MKILFWTDGFWPRLGGIETQGFHFIEAMQQRGHRYKVLAQSDHPGWQEEENHRGISIKRFDFNEIIEKRDLKILVEIRDYLESILRDFQPNIIHLNASVGGVSLAFSIFQKMFRMPIIATVHAPSIYNNTFAPVIAKIATSMDQICCVSNWVLDEMKRHLPQLKSKLRLIYNGLAMPEITPAPLSFSPPTLLLFGRLCKEKGFDTGIRAFSLLKKGGSNARLIVAGGGPIRPALEKLAEEEGVSQFVKFTGVLTQEEVISTFNQAALVIVPSLIESFGLVILESMQMQRPVIASKIEGIPEVVLDGETGVLVPAREPIALFRAIQDLLADPEKAKEMGIKGRKRAMQRFTLHQNVLQYEDLYSEMRPPVSR